MPNGVCSVLLNLLEQDKHKTTVTANYEINSFWLHTIVTQALNANSQVIHYRSFIDYVY